MTTPNTNEANAVAAQPGDTPPTPTAQPGDTPPAQASGDTVGNVPTPTPTDVVTNPDVTGAPTSTTTETPTDSVTVTEEREYVTARGTVITVQELDGKTCTVADDPDGSRRYVDTDVFDSVVSLAALLNL